MTATSSSTNAQQLERRLEEVSSLPAGTAFGPVLGEMRCCLGRAEAGRAVRLLPQAVFIISFA